MVNIVIFLGFLAILLFVLNTVFRDEVQAAMDRDPAATSALIVLLTYPGVHAIIYYRLSHKLHTWKFTFLARVVSQLARTLTGIEIHPGAQIGKRLFIDHGMGVVIGETTIIGENVTLFQQVTLGGTGKEKGKRHPTLGNNIVVGTGAKVLGNIKLGDNVSVGANAVVLRDVPANSTVVGVPGRITQTEGKKNSGINLNYTSLPDPLTQSLDKLQLEIDKIERELRDFGSGDSKKK